jgi:hypothetical protein
MWIAAAALCAWAAPAAAAGDVTADIDPTTRELRITGDTSANDIEITWDGTPGGYIVTGRDGTTVNGVASFSAQSARGILVNLGAGNDRIAVTQARVRGALRVRGDEGDDEIVLNGVRLRGRAALRGGAGADKVTVLNQCVFNSTFNFLGDTGEDSVEAHDSEFRNRVRVDTGQMNDTLLFEGCNWQGQARFEVETRVGDDRMEINGCDFDNRVDVEMGRDDDDLILDSSDFHDDVDFDGGSGDDDISIRSGVDFRDVPGIHSFDE